jgi:hypothetical protein
MLDAFCTSGSSPTEAGPDFRCENHGSLFLLFPLTQSAQSWIEEHLPSDAQRFGNAFVIEHRYIWAILADLQDDGLTVANGLECPATKQAEVISPPDKKRRGRPPKNAIAMTPAERKAASRANQKRNEQDAEREKIITALRKMYRLPGGHSLLRESDLSHVPTEKLRESLESKPVEIRGRLWGERPTEEKRLERLAMAKIWGGRRVGPKGRGPDS